MAALRRTSAARLANLLLRRNKIAKARHRDQPFHRLRRRPGRADEIRVEIAAAAFVRRVRDGLDSRPWLAELHRGLRHLRDLQDRKNTRMNSSQQCEFCIPSFACKKN